MPLRLSSKPEPVVPDPAPPEPDPAVRYERERVDAWIRNGLIAYPLASCFRCRKPIIAGQDWQEVSNGEARSRFHRDCHAEWRAEREAAARRRWGLRLKALRSTKGRHVCAAPTLPLWLDSATLW